MRIFSAPSPAANGQNSPPLSDTILVVDDDLECVEIVVESLRGAGYTVKTVADGEVGLAWARDFRPAMVITEVALIGLSGLELCRALRADPATEEIQVMMLTTSQSGSDRILGYELGADDYIAKPCNAQELVLRVKAVQRRSQGWRQGVVKAGPISVDHARCCAVVNGEAIELTPTEFKLLATLAERPNVVQTRDRLLSEVWGNEHAIENRSVDTYLRRLRNKLGEAGRHIKTVYGFGYRIAC
ncbi:MAG: response regulator transcription factor [Chthoniobacter sp.]|uniref:response regulator transcription factor n=1 Tax=Chthoniobacter sp. TaxID=2510640 RepID=UPI0032A5510A